MIEKPESVEKQQQQSHVKSNHEPTATVFIKNMPSGRRCHPGISQCKRQYEGKEGKPKQPAQQPFKNEREMLYSLQSPHKNVHVTADIGQ
jgi:hypothetical protein